jgi:uncharacterized cupredoxin-like copper-binding protein
MKKLSGVALAVLFVASICLSAMAADTVATVTGTVSVANNVPSIKVESAKGADGKAIADLAGKSLTVVGAKVADVSKMSGKKVEATGTLKENNTQIDVTSCKEAAAPKPAERKQK